MNKFFVTKGANERAHNEGLATRFKRLGVTVLFLFVFLSFVSAVSSINYDLPNFCGSDVETEYIVDFSDYMTLDFSKELAVCYMSVCTGPDTGTKVSSSPICFKNGEMVLGVFDWSSSLLYDVWNLSTYGLSESTECVALFGLAECDPDIDPDRCYNRLFDDGGWSWLPSSRYNDKMNIHSVFEINDPDFDIYDVMDSKGWGPMVGDFCTTSSPPPQSSDNATLKDNLFSYFRMDINGLSSTGNSVLTYGSPSFLTNGILGKSYHNINNSRLQVDYPVINNNNWTYGFWVKGNGSQGYILDTIDFTLSSNNHISAYVDNNYLKFTVGANTLTTYLMSNNWSMNTIKLENGVYSYYRNGVKIFTSSYTNNVDFSNTLLIGSNYYGINGFTGYLDEMYFFGRVLSDSEITQLYNLGSSLTFDGYDFVSTSPNYTADVSHQHPDKILNYNQTYCFDADYYFDNTDSYVVWYNNPPTDITDPPFDNSLSTGEGSLNADYFEIYNGVYVGRPDSEICIESYERDTNFTITVQGYGGSSYDEQDIDFFVSGDYDVAIKTYYPYQFRYVLSPANPSQFFSFNYFYANYDDVSVTFDDGGNTTLSCGIGDDVTHNYDGNISVDLICNNSNVYLYVFSNNISWDGFFYTNVSNEVSSVSDYFNLVVFSGAPQILSLHDDIAIAYYSVYTDQPESYFSDFDSVDVLFRIPETNNYRRISVGDGAVTYDDYYTFDYRSDGSLFISTMDTSYYDCVFYEARNSFGTSVVSYLKTITQQGVEMASWDCDNVWDIIDNNLDDSIDGEPNSWFSGLVSSFSDIWDVNISYEAGLMTFWMIVLVFAVGMYSVFGSVKITLIFGLVFAVGFIGILAFFSYGIIGIINPRLVTYSVVAVIALLVGLWLRGGGK